MEVWDVLGAGFNGSWFLRPFQGSLFLGGPDLLACGWGWDVAGFLGRGAICFHRSEA